ncbi:hypothetical protein ACSBR2_011958 [Camellia fascicularis]
MMKQSIPNKKKKKHSIPKELPCQIILEILSRLPIKTLFLCQLVSKHWLSLISDPHFVNLHLSRSPVSLLLKPFYRNRRSYQLHLVDLQTLHKIHPREAQLKLNPKFNFPLLGDQIVNSCNDSPSKPSSFANLFPNTGFLSSQTLTSSISTSQDHQSAFCSNSSTSTVDRTNSTWLTSKPSRKSIPAKPN